MLNAARCCGLMIMMLALLDVFDARCGLTLLMLDAARRSTAHVYVVRSQCILTLY